MKSTLFKVAGIIIVVGLIVIIFSLIFGTNIIQDAFNAVGNYINEFWQKVSGSDTDIFSEVTAVTRDSVAF